MKSLGLEKYVDCKYQRLIEHIEKLRDAELAACKKAELAMNQTRYTEHRKNYRLYCQLLSEGRIAAYLTE